MTKAQAGQLLDSLFLSDEWGRKLIGAADRRKIFATLAALPDSVTKRLRGPMLLPDRRRAVAAVVAKYPDPALIKMLLASYKRLSERPDAKIRAVLEAIKPVGAPIESAQRAPKRRG